MLDNADKVIAKGRLGPGQMVLADIAAGTFKTNTEIARDVARKHPYKQWLSRSRRLEELGASKGFLKAPLMTAADALKLQASSGVILSLVHSMCKCSHRHSLRHPRARLFMLDVIAGSGPPSMCLTCVVTLRRAGRGGHADDHRVDGDGGRGADVLHG